MKDSILLFSNFIRNPREVGALLPSSKFLAREIARNINFKRSKRIVELGPGSGTFTKLIVRKAASDAWVVCIETNKRFCSYLAKNIPDARLKIINSGAQNIRRNLKKLNIRAADCIISGLPFSNFSLVKKKRILHEVHCALAKNGRFVLFQYTNGLNKLLKKYFTEINKTFIPWNMPPSFVYVCEK